MAGTIRQRLTGRARVLALGFVAGALLCSAAPTSTTPPYIRLPFILGLALMLVTMFAPWWIIRCPRCGWRFGYTQTVRFAMDVPLWPYTQFRLDNCPGCNVGLDHPVP